MPRHIFVIIFSIILIAINHITSLKQTHLFFGHFPIFLDNDVDEKNPNNFQEVKAQTPGVLYIV